jgi:hypothetical protein
VSGSFVKPFGDKTFQHFTFMIDCTPKVKSLAVDFDKDFIQAPLPVCVVPCPVLTDFSRALLPETELFHGKY